MSPSCSACSSGCIHRKISPAPAPDSRSSSGSSADTAGACGRRGGWARVRRSTSRCRRGNPIMSDTWGTLNVPGQSSDSVRGYDGPAIASVDAWPEVPSLDLSTADSLSEAEASATMIDPHLTRRYWHCATWCGGLVIAIGCLALVGWLTGTTVFASISLEWTTMKANTAIGLIAAFWSLCLNVNHAGDRALPR